MSKQSAPPICRQPDHIISYFSMQKGILAVITVYEVGPLRLADFHQ